MQRETYVKLSHLLLWPGEDLELVYTNLDLLSRGVRAWAKWQLGVDVILTSVRILDEVSESDSLHCESVWLR